MAAHLTENFLKFIAYFKPVNFYWQLTPVKSWFNDKYKLGRYPLDMVRRLKTGHYYRFDSRGLPIMVSVYRKYHGKRLIHYYTTLSSYAFAHWDLFLLNGKKQEAETVLKVAEYMIETGYVGPNDELLLRCENEKGEHEGGISAMDQGMSLSVFSRAWVLTGNEKYIDYAYKALKPFTKKVEEGGVVGWFSKIMDIWYEEDAMLPLRHILNGKIYALWGIYDFFRVTGDEMVLSLFNRGIKSLAKALKYFDNNFWSLYYYPEDGKKFYIASMMYQNLHICQLKALYYQTGEEIFKYYADKFESYAKNPLNRLRAALVFLNHKISRL